MKDYELPDHMKRAVENLEIPAAVYCFADAKVVTLGVSKGFLKLFDIKTAEEAIRLMDTDMYCDTHPEDVARVADIAYRFATQGGTYEAVYRTKMAEGEYHIVHSTGKHIYAPDGTRLALVWYLDETAALRADPSEAARKLMDALRENVENETRERKVNYDDLTGLPTMMYFLQLAGAEREKIQNAGDVPVILFMDLNGLKYYNHHYGFAQGDDLVRSLGKLIRHYFGSENAGRFAADHFAVLTKDEGLTAKLRDLFEDLGRACEGRTLPLRVGIYEDTFGEVSITTACDRAKIACDSNRNIYRSRYVYFDREMLEQSHNKEYILNHFDEALEKHWILDYYQPIIRTETGKVSDEEALARWKDPENGMMRPDQFIPVLEDAGLLYKLDLYMVDRIVEHILKKQKLGIPVVPVSVNLSERDFVACDMAEEITKRLTNAGVSRSALTIEVTERAIGQYPELLKNVIEKFHSLGYKVWLDDFGSDYSSLNVLQDYRFDLIKLDMKFLRKFNTNSMSRLIISEVLDLAKKARMETVTEGVETKEQVAFLSDAGCIKLQGFLYSRPVPEEEIIETYLRGDSLVPEEDENHA